MGKSPTPNHRQIYRYWREAFALAWKETELLSWSKVLTTLGFAVVGLLFQWAIGVRAFDLTIRIIGTVIAAYILVALVTFAGNLIRTPAAKDSENQQEIEKLTAQIATQRSREDILNQLIQFSESGHQQLQRCKIEYVAEWQTEADSWMEQVSDYLERTLGKPLSTRFRNSLIRSSLYQYSSSQHRALYDGLYVRLESLDKIIETLHSGQTLVSSPEPRSSMKLLRAGEMPRLLALAEEWSKLHETFLRGVGDSAESQVSDLMRRTEVFLKEELDDCNAAMVKNAPPEHPNLHGRQTRDKHYIGVAAAKLKKMNQIIEEQRRAN